MEGTPALEMYQGRKKTNPPERKGTTDRSTLTALNSRTITLTHQSPHRVMSTTSCCAPKNWGMLHVEFGYAAEAGPQVEMSSESVAVVIEAGTLARYGRGRKCVFGFNSSSNERSKC